jgi:hypothetical protein
VTLAGEPGEGYRLAPIALNGATMRRYLFVVPFLFACAKGENAPADSAAAATAPAALTEADVAGNWSGNLMMEGSDSVVATWTEVCGSGTCRLVVSTAPKDTVVGTYMIMGDSVMYTVAAHPDPSQKGAMVTEAGSGHITAGTLTGSGRAMLAAKPDSIVMRYKFTGTKAP